MTRYLQIALLPVPLGLLIGILAAATIVDRGLIGWVLCVGLGLMGGAFLAAIASGDALVSGPAAKRGSVSDAPWLSRSQDDE